VNVRKLNLGVKMGEPARKLEFEDVPQTVTQYWICSPVECDTRGQDVYFLDDGWYAVSGYISREDHAIRMCPEGKKVAAVEVYNYLPSQLHARKKEIEFKKWSLDRVPKPKAP
jgi:hypothetical protein